jgi:hypothetical protein
VDIEQVRGCLTLSFGILNQVLGLMNNKSGVHRCLSATSKFIVVPIRVDPGTRQQMSGSVAVRLIGTVIGSLVVAADPGNVERRRGIIQEQYE